MQLIDQTKEKTQLQLATGVAKKYLGFIAVLSLFINLAMLAVPIYMLQLYDRVLTSYHHYKDRADCENNFDELKNQWGWSGFVTQDLKRSRIMARCIALIYNWWSLFARLIDPSKHSECYHQSSINVASSQ